MPESLAQQDKFCGSSGIKTKRMRCRQPASSIRHRKIYLNLRTNVKPLVHWAIYKHFILRFTKRSPTMIEGILTTPQGKVKFEYDPQAMTVRLPEEQIAINEHGWELSRSGKRDSHDPLGSTSAIREDD